MSTIGAVTILLTGDDSAFKATLKQSESRIGKFTSGLIGGMDAFEFGARQIKDWLELTSSVMGVMEVTNRKIGSGFDENVQAAEDMYDAVAKIPVLGKQIADDVFKPFIAQIKQAQKETEKLQDSLKLRADVAAGVVDLKDMAEHAQRRRRLMRLPEGIRRIEEGRLDFEDAKKAVEQKLQQEMASKKFRFQDKEILGVEAAREKARLAKSRGDGMPTREQFTVRERPGIDRGGGLVFREKDYLDAVVKWGQEVTRLERESNMARRTLHRQALQTLSAEKAMAVDQLSAAMPNSSMGTFNARALQGLESTGRADKIAGKIDKTNDLLRRTIEAIRESQLRVE